MNPKVVKAIMRIKARVVWPVVVIVLGAAYVGNKLAGSAVQQEDLDVMQRVTLAAVRDGCSVIFWAVLIPASILLTIQVLVWALRNFAGLFEVEVEQEKEEEKLPPVIRSEVTEISDLMERINRQIADLERRRDEARGQLRELETSTFLFSRLIDATAARMDQLDTTRATLTKAREALRHDQPDLVDISELAGAIDDPELALLMDSPYRHRFNERLVLAISRQIGAVSAHIIRLDRLTDMWIAQLADYKERTFRLTETVESSDALPVILRIHGHLETAQRALGYDMDDVETVSVVGRVQIPHIDYRQLPGK